MAAGAKAVTVSTATAVAGASKAVAGTVSGAAVAVVSWARGLGGTPVLPPAGTPQIQGVPLESEQDFFYTI